MYDSLQPHGLNSPWNSPGKNTGVGSCSLLQGIFPTQGSPPLQAYSLPAEPQGKPSIKIILNFIESIQHTAWHTEIFIVDTGGDITYCYYFCGLMFSPNPQFSSILSFQFSRYKTTSNHYYGEGNGNPLQFIVWKTPWTEEPGGLQSIGSQRVWHDWAPKTHTQSLLMRCFHTPGGRWHDMWPIFGWLYLACQWPGHTQKLKAEPAPGWGYD